MQKINPCHIKDFAKNFLPKKLRSKKITEGGTLPNSSCDPTSP